jgi:hypothetical protein
MAASIDVTGLAKFNQSIRRAVAGDLQKTMVKSLQDAGPKIAADMHGSTFTRIQRRAVGSVTVQRSRDGIDIAGGRGGDLAAVLFDGGEYGGRKSRKVRYATRSPLGRAYIVNRRTTMQFLVHLGKEGWFYWPTIRLWMPKLAKQQEELLQKALEGR